MFAKQTPNKFRLGLFPQQTVVEFPRQSTFPLPGEAKFASPPALANNLFQLDACLSAPVCDLASVTNIIRSDIGLTVQLLRLAAAEIEHSPEDVVPLGEIVVHVGLDNLKRIVNRTGTVPDEPLKEAAFGARELFWMHARLAALVAEERAGFYGVTSEEAYLAGLLRPLGELAELSDLTLSDLTKIDITQADAGRADVVNVRAIGSEMARSWGFAQILVDVIAGHDEACRSHKARILLHLSIEADNWASRLEYLAAQESPMCLQEIRSIRPAAIRNANAARNS